MYRSRPRLKITLSMFGLLLMATGLIAQNGKIYATTADNTSAVLVTKTGKLVLQNATITTSGEGANALFASGAASQITASNLVIATSADSARGLEAIDGGTIVASNLNISTQGRHSATIATDRGEGTITVNGVTARTTGQGSPGIYSTGTVTVKNGDFLATGSEAAIVDGKNSITLQNTKLVGSHRWGVMLYQSFSGDAGGGTSRFTMDGGSLEAKLGPLFYSTNTHGVVKLRGVALVAHSGILINVGSNQWGTSGSNGGNLEFSTRNQTMEGDVIVDKGSSASLVLKEVSHLRGRISQASLSLDATSTWTVTGDSSLTGLVQTGGSAGITLSRIKDQGHRVTYDSSLAVNQWLGGKSYQLASGGSLKPAK